MPKVSVIIPCYNHGRYLDDAVDSMLRQTFQDIEILIINDGSTDAFTVQKLEGYTKPKATVFHTPNRGLAAARNTGIARAQGDYILPLDADDYFDTTFLEKAVTVLETEAKVGVVSCGLQYFGHSSRQVLPVGGDVRICLAKSGVIGNSMFRKVCWEEAEGYNEQIAAYEDWDFWLRVGKRGWLFHVIPEYLFHYRQHPMSMRVDARAIRPELILELVRNHREVFERYIEEAIFEREQKIFSLAQKKRSLTQSAEYKLGKLLLSPIRGLQKMFMS